jgi:hypothetical protein
VLGNLNTAAEQAFKDAAFASRNQDLILGLEGARKDYREMMETVFSGPVKDALRKNPEDIGRLFWQSGNVSEIEQLQKLTGIAQREGKMAKGETIKLNRDMARGFLQEAVPSVQSAAKWSETLAADPKKARTFEALTKAAGASGIADGMKILEEAAKIALRGAPSTETALAIPLHRAALGGLGVSWFTGTIHGPMLAILKL